MVLIIATPAPTGLNRFPRVFILECCDRAGSSPRRHIGYGTGVRGGSLLAAILLALALAADAAAVSAGLGAARVSMRVLVVSASLFGVFQAGMAGVGAVAGAWLVRVASAWDHWIAFGLLAFIGMRMLFPGDDEDERRDVHLVALVVLAIATSIDALAAGITLPMMQPPVWVTVATIGVVTSAASLAAGTLGRRAGDRFGAHMERVGGLVLIAIGVRILVEHTLFA